MTSISSESVFIVPPLRIAMRQFVRVLLLSLICLLAMPVFADTFVVDVSSDGVQNSANATTCEDQNNPGHCSLRAAIMIGNTLANSHTITFSPNVLKITVINGNLPTMKAPFTVVGNHIITIDGNGNGCFDLTDTGTQALGHSEGATGSKITDMVIGNCNGSGIDANGHNYIFVGNFIGVDATGLNAMPNTLHGIVLSASHVYPDTSTNFLSNLYGTLPVQPIDASQINAFSNNLATALASLTPVVISGNVISGNMKNGIEIYSQNMAAVLISGNKIGTDLSGNIAIANGGDGVHMVGSTFSNLIGPDNVISGNSGNGIFVEAGTVFMPSYIMGNRIGLAATDGSAHIGNGLSGIRTDTLPDVSATSYNPAGLALLIGPSNLISDNKGVSASMLPDTLGDDDAGLRITGASRAVTVVNNTIGMAEFPTGIPLASKAYGNVGDGIIVTSSGNTIGGSTNSGNIIAGNARHGIVVSGSGTTATNIQGNLIGVHSAFAGNVSLGNGVDGVHVDSANSTNVGGPAAGDFNTIAGNGRNGLKIRMGDNHTYGWSNLAQRNLIYSNAKLSGGVGLDLDYNENMVDQLHDEFTHYANLDQAAPIICVGAAGEPNECIGFSAPISSGATTTFTWTFKSHGPATFRLEFFQIDAASDNAATSMTFLGEQQISTLATGFPSGAGCSGGHCTATIAASTAGAYVLMTATDITPLNDQPSALGDWKDGFTCFADVYGVLLPACKVNDTSEFSNVVSIPVAAPTVTTLAATALAQTGATLNGTVSANGAATTVAFDYGTTSAYGSTLSGGAPLAGNASNAAVSAPLSGLTCNTTYHFRITADNSAGTTLGNDMTFTTLACAAAAPTVTTLAATALAQTGATLNGTVSANGAATTVVFDYGTTSAYGSTLSGGAPLAGNASNAAVSAPLSGLTCNTTYHFRITADNSAGTTLGNDMTFTTLACAAAAPTVTTLVATALAQTGATLNGTVSANGAATTVAFDYGTTSAYGSTLSGGAPLAGNASNAAVSAPLSGLTCNTTYHFRITADNSAGTTLGNDMTFTTLACAAAAPTVTTLVATALAQTGATLNGTVSANGAATTVAFDYGTTSAYGSTLSGGAPLAGNASNAAVSAPLSGLTCNTTYHFRITADNSAGTTLGNDMTFTTLACAAAAPTVTTLAATALAQTGATLNGTVSANGAATTVVFDYGTTSAYGSTLSGGAPLAGNASNAAVSAPLSGLTCNTTYHFRITADNSAGTTLGNDMTFTTLACAAAAPTVTTLVATALAQTGATLNGTVSANGAATTVAFDYGTTSAYGSTLSGGAPLAGNASNAAVSAPLSGLTCNTTYHFRITADNSAGTTLGNDMTFTTLACAAAAPTVTTLVATALAQTGATLNGTVSANGAATTVAFDYGTTSAYGSTLSGGAPLAGNASNAAVSAPLSGLTCNTTYHFRITADNSAGTTLGNDMTFTTLACAAAAPTVTTLAATALAQTGATLNGTVSANGAATTVVFDYGTTSAYGSTLSGGAPLAGNASNAAVSAPLSGLTCNTTYHFRITADNSAGTTLGNDMTFTTLACSAAAPTVTTLVATALAQTGATLNGTVSANGAATTVAFDYGTTSAYGSTLSGGAPLAGNASNAAVSAPLSGLTCNTTYHFRITADNSAGTTLGNDMTFTTLACAAAAPTVTTLAATALAQTGATLNGTVTANGAVTTVSFEYGLTSAYGTTQAAGLANANAINLPLSAPLSGLTCNTTYHFRIDANNGNGGTVFGNDLSFTTLACPVVTNFSGMTSTNSGTATAVLSGGGATCSFGNTAFVAPSAAVPAGVNFPDGLFQFTTTNCSGAITITVTFPTAFQPAAQYWKYGPTPGQAAAHWYTLGAANTLTMSGHTATFNITDGALGDDDLAVNGSIVDAGGPSAINPTAVAATPVPSLNQWGLMLLCGLLVTVAGRGIRIR